MHDDNDRGDLIDWVVERNLEADPEAWRDEPEPEPDILSDAQVLEAIEQVRAHCDLLMGNYESVSMRGALYVLGFQEHEADQVIAHCAAHGFDYCLDPGTAHSRSGTRPPAYACYWGPDQLKSRLDSLRS